MDGEKHNHCWIHVTKVEKGHEWICKHCNLKFNGDASRIEADLGRGGIEAHRSSKVGEDIRRCSYHPVAGNEGVHNNMASTSSNPPEAVNRSIHSIQVQGVNRSGCNRSVFGNEVNHLKQLVFDLECEENYITKQLQRLKSHGKKRKQEVDIWLEELLEIKERVDAMNNLNDTHDIYELFKDMKRHKEEKPLTLSTEFVGKALDFNIRKVLKLLEDDQVFVIGIYGMGGVGKTLLATLVENEVKRKPPFIDVFWVTVSPNFKILELQHDIAKRIGVKLDEDDEKIGADNLSSALQKKRKSVIILDDVWKYIDLEKVGIHTKVNGIKVILTTRLKLVCQQMDCMPNHMINMKPLDGVNEDWELFKVKLGHRGTPATLSPEIENIARHIVSRCEGLPLGISVIARTMKGIDDIHQWKHSLNELNKLEMGQEVVEEVFKVLRRSYDNLIEEDLQNCFLYCALLSNDDEFDKDELIMKLVDNKLINGNKCLEEIFDDGNTIFDKLKAHSLMSSSHYSSVYNYRLVIDMACYIMKESKRNAMVKFGNELTKRAITQEWADDLELVHLWSCDIEEIPESIAPYCQRLSTLVINKLSISHVPESFFEYIDNLTILDLSNNKKLESLPNSITKLISLVSLVLTGCHSLTHVPPVGELWSLSRLVISDCSIKEAPQGLDKLHLKWLDLSHNKSLNLELGSLNLNEMQYLDLQDTLAMITVEDIQRMNMLECLGVAFDCKHYNQYMQKNLDMSFDLKTYHFRFGNVCGESKSVWWNYINLKRFDPSDPETKTILFRDCDHFSHILPKDLTYLCIEKNGHWVCLCDALSYNTASSLRKIGAYDCQQLESLFCLSGSCSFCTKIHNLEDLELRSMESLIVVCKDVVDVRQSLTSGIFSYLKTFHICDCHLIEKLLTPRLVQQLQNLETISVKYCNSMKEIFAMSNNDDDESSSITLPKLTTLELYNLPQLKIVCKGRIRCGSSPLKLDVSKCPSLERYPTIENEDVDIPCF